MHFNPNYILREIAGESLLVRQGHEGIDLTCVVALNPSGTFLFHKFHDSEFSIDEMIQAILDEYDVDIDTARHDTVKWLNIMKQHNAITD